MCPRRRAGFAPASDYAEAYNNIAAGYNALKMWDQGIQAASEAVRLKPGRWVLAEQPRPRHRAKSHRESGPPLSSLVLLIPAYQPAPELPSLVRNILDATRGIIDRAVILNDGSAPRCDAIFAELQSIDRVHVIAHAINLGKGAALKTGFNFILTTWPSVTGIVTADADGQHLPADIRHHCARPCCIPRSIDSWFPCLSRRSAPSQPHRQSAHPIHLSPLHRPCLTRHANRTPRLASPQCLEALRLPFNGYEFEFEHLVKASRTTIREVPIRQVYESGNKSSHFNPVRDSFRIYFVFCAIRLPAMLAAVLDSTVFSLVLWRTGDLLISQVAGRHLATVVAFFVLRHIVFRSTEQAWKSLLRFLTLVVISGAVSLHLIEALVEGGVSPLSAKLLAEGTLFVADFAVPAHTHFPPRLTLRIVQCQ